MTVPHAYDFDGVLAEGPPAPAKAWGKMKGPERLERKASLLRHYAKAARLVQPAPGPFHVITARRATEEADGGPVRRVSLGWLHMHYPGRCIGLHMLPTGRTLEKVIAFKAGCILALGVVDFYEDNLAVCRGVAKLCPGVRVWRVHPMRPGQAPRIARLTPTAPPFQSETLGA